MENVDETFAQNWIEEAKVFHQEVYEGEELMVAIDDYGVHFCVPPSEHPAHDMWDRRTVRPQRI